jgi:hypothetical protein
MEPRVDPWQLRIEDIVGMDLKDAAFDTPEYFLKEQTYGSVSRDARRGPRFG